MAILKIAKMGHPILLQKAKEVDDPTDPKIKRKLFLTTIIATIIWVPVCLIIIFEVITISDINFYNKLRG